MTNYNLPQRLNVRGEDWELVKNANDPSVGFPFERVKPLDFDCQQIRDGLYRMLVVGVVTPAKGSLEQPKRLAFIGFSRTPVMQQYLMLEHLKTCSIYKAEMGEFAKDFTEAFLGKGQEENKMYDIKPYPEGEINNGTRTDNDA